MNVDRLLPWSGFVLGLAATAISVLGFVEARRATAITEELETQRLVDQAWVLMGGESGAKILMLGVEYRVGSQARLEQARRLLDQALARDPNHSEARLRRGNYFHSLGDRLPDAITEYRTALRLDPDDAATHSWLGLALTDQGRFDEAITAQEAAIVLEPDNVIFRYNLASTLRLKGEGAEADRVEAQARALRASRR